MADTETDEAKISIKVIIDKVKKRVVYAEADYTFIDILFSFITLPMGTIVRLLGKLDDKKFESCLGSLNNLYQSLNDFPECYLASEECKFLLLNPRSLSYDHCRKLKLKLDDTEPLTYFRCATCLKYDFPKKYLSICSKAKCQICGNKMNDGHWTNFDVDDFIWGLDLRPGVCSSDGGVFVSDIATFIVTDDLCVMPYTSASSIQLLTDCGITDNSCLEDLKLDMGCEQMLFFLKMVLSLDSVFTSYVFHETSLIQKDQNLAVPCESSIFDETDLLKNKESSEFLLEVTLQKSTGKLLFVEAKEDFVDFLFGFLSIPLGTVTGELMKGASCLTCVNNIVKSITDMSVGRYLKSQMIKDTLLEPHIGQHYFSNHQVFPLKGTPCNEELQDPRKYGQFLKQSGLFFVTDDLRITPSSSNSTISTLTSLKVSFDDIEKHEITIGLKEGLSILKASLRSCSTLTDSLEHLLQNVN